MRYPEFYERKYADAAQLTAKHYSFADGIRNDGALASLLVNAERASRSAAHAAHVPASATTFTGAGQVVMTGGWVSVTTTVCWHVAELP